LYYVMEADGTGALTSGIIAKEGEPERKQDINMTMKLRMGFETKVGDVDQGGAATLTTRLSEYRLSQDGKDIIDFKSDDERNVTNETNSALIELYKNPITMKVTPLGGVINVSGIDRLSKTVPQMDIAGLIKQTQQKFPEKAVDVGDTWDENIDFSWDNNSGKKKNTVAAKYEFMGYETVKDLRCARIHVKGEGDLSDVFNSIPSEIPGSVMDTKSLFVRYEGDIYFAPAEGVLTAFDFTMNQDVAAVITIKQGADSLKLNMSLNMALSGVYELK
ncbi:MAG TPA: hypothetical protein PLQ76_09230, partial [bacterium]|nr:hypothetical protein [bacterium]